ncbi:MAG: hypothetical protein Q7S18_02460, partial [bacterium]|nr:hypothetical protein [bacterium]
ISNFQLQMSNQIQSSNDKILNLDSALSAHSTLLATLQTQMDDIKTQNQAISDFFNVLNPETLVTKDIAGNVDLLKGKLTVASVEALGTVKAKDIEAENSLKGENLKLGEATRGTGEIKAGDTEVEIKTVEASNAAQIYITPRGQYDKIYYSEEDIKEGESFKVKIDEPVSHTVKFNWLIIK